MIKSDTKYMGIHGGHHRRVVFMNMAEQFIDRGSSVVFLKPNSNEPLTDKYATDLESAENVYSAYPSANIAAVVGVDNNLIAIMLKQESQHDPDPQEVLSELEIEYGTLPPTMTIIYPNGSRISLYEYPEGKKVMRSNLASSIKILHNNMYGTGLVMLEPSNLPDGAVRTHNHESRISKLPDSWVSYVCSDPYGFSLEQLTDGNSNIPITGKENELETIVPDLGIVPDWIVPKVSDSEVMKAVTPEEYLQMSIVKMVKVNLEPDEALANAKMICSQYDLQIDSDKLALMLFDEYKNVGASGRYCMVGNDEALARFIGEVELDVFKDDNQSLRCKIKETGEIVSLTSNVKPGNKVAELITRKFLLMTNTVPKQQALKDTLRVFESHARFSKNEIKLYNRVGLHHGVIYYDLGNSTSIRISEHGWEQVVAPSIFKRAPNIKAQVLPLTSGKFESFFDFVNCEPQDRLLLAVYMIAALIPDINHPVLYVYGAHGSAKSNLTSKIKMVCDPSPDGCQRLTLSNKKQEVVRNLSQYHVVVYDNISNISGEISDAFCMASTGGGSDDRKFYTNEDSNIMQFKCCPILNSVKMCIKKPDLLDRAILVRLNRLKHHKNEAEINAAFQNALPGILGNMFDILVAAMVIYPTVQIDENYRMADFAKWGFAIAEAMGGKGKQFLSDYEVNYLVRNEHVAQGNTLCDAVIELMANRTEYKAAIAVAYAALKRQSGADKRDKTFPDCDKMLRPYLEELGPVLAAYNIMVDFGKRTNKGWPVTFTKFTPEQTENYDNEAKSPETTVLSGG